MRKMKLQMIVSFLLITCLISGCSNEPSIVKIANQMGNNTTERLAIDLNATIEMDFQKEDQGVIEYVNETQKNMDFITSDYYSKQKNSVVIDGQSKVSSQVVYVNHGSDESQNIYVNQGEGWKKETSEIVPLYEFTQIDAYFNQYLSKMDGTELSEGEEFNGRKTWELKWTTSLDNLPNLTGINREAFGSLFSESKGNLYFDVRLLIYQSDSEYAALSIELKEGSRIQVEKLRLNGLEEITESVALTAFSMYLKLDTMDYADVLVPNHILEEVGNLNGEETGAKALEAGQFTLCGRSFTLNSLRVEDLLALGYTLENGVDGIDKVPYEFEEKYILRKGNNTIGIEVNNYQSDGFFVKDMLVHGIMIKADNALVLDSNIQVGSSMSDVQDVFGKSYTISTNYESTPDIEKYHYYSLDDTKELVFIYQGEVVDAIHLVDHAYYY